MPNVPFLPGVPPLNGYSAAGAVQLLFTDLLGLLSGSITPQWGIFLDGEPVIACDNVVSFDFRRRWNESDYQIEKGGFESYNKVETPFETRVRMSAGGSEIDRQNFLSSVEDIAGDLQLYDVVTPERVYQSVNITGYEYKRTSVNGVGLLVIDVSLLEIRETAEVAFSSTTAREAASGRRTTTLITIRPGNTIDPTSSSPSSGGTVQPTQPTAQEENWTMGLGL